MGDNLAKVEEKSPPAGTGYLPGLGEAFSVNLNTGQGTYTYQIPLPEGVAKHGPKLSLEYTHGAGCGAWGLGWRLPLRSITRRLDFGTPSEGITERFSDGGIDLISAKDGSFRAMRETSFARYTRLGDRWKIEERNGQVYELGKDPGARVADPDHPDRVTEWLVERTLDVSGNAVSYQYLTDHGFAYPKSITYAAYEVRLSYENRPDVRRDGRAGFSRQRTLRCSRLQLVLDPGAGERVIRTYEFVYENDPRSGVSLLAEIHLTANGAAPDGSQDVRRPTVRFHYSRFDPGKFHLSWMGSESGPPPALTDDEVAVATLDNAPLPGILMNRNGREYYWPNAGAGKWAEPRPIPRAPLAFSFRSAGLAFVDMDGSGTADLMVATDYPLQGFYENEGRAGWGAFTAFPRFRGTPRWSDPSLRMIDVDGDGLIDALASQERAFLWWRNQGDRGWASPLVVPKSSEDLREVDFADRDIHLADMTGDGSQDIVRVRSGRVEYWPNLGGGRFGEKVVMQRSPRFRRNPGNDTLILADVDGDGCSDLIHVSSEGITIHQNQNGTRFADPIVIGDVPPAIPGTVRAVDVNGVASAALLWNSQVRWQPSYVQFEFAPEQPPYLLTRIENGSGLVSEIKYRSAIKDYLDDLQKGVIWSTNFPFPYLVVGGTKETDSVSGRVVEIDFVYHEAHFERRTRQFQGFRHTDRVEKGDSSRPDLRLVHRFLMAQERVPGNGPEHAALNGMLASIETYQVDGSPMLGVPFRTEASEYGLTVLDINSEGRKRSFVFVKANRQEYTERTADSRVEEKTYSYDADGNVVREVHRGSGKKGGIDQAVRERTTEITYAASTIHYLLDKPARIAIRDGEGQLLTEKRLYYDGPAFVGQPLGQADRGLVTREEEWVMSKSDFDTHYQGVDRTGLGFVTAPNADGIASVFATTQANDYDNRGVLVATQDPLGNERWYTYDPADLFRVKLDDSLGTTSFDYDRATGQITQVAYPDGEVTRFDYDAQGRVLKSALPGEDLGNPATVYSYDETSVPNRRVVTFQQEGGFTSVGITYFDGYGKEFQQRVGVAPNKFLVSGLKLPNPWGDMREEYEPSFSTSPDFSIPDTAVVPSRRFYYDACGRVTRTVNFNGGLSTAEYLPFGVVLRDANDNDDSAANVARHQYDTPHEEEFDVFRYMTRVTEHLGAGKTAVSSYEIGPMGELLSISDDNGVKFRYQYDRRGNRLVVSLREAGDRKIWYDARKKPVQTLDAAGNLIRARWDALGRLTRLSKGQTVLEKYRYDTLARHALGRLAEVQYVGGSQTFTYDRAGKLIRREYHYDGEAAPQSLRYEYDRLGRELAVIHTDGTRIERQLTFNGWLKALPNVILGVEYDARGLPSSVAYQNGVRTSFTYTSGPGRIATLTTLSPQNNPMQQIDFEFDKMEMILGMKDGAASTPWSREFSYDPLYQLTGSSSIENGNPVQRSYDYKADYNLSRLDESRSTLEYNDAARPDRATGLTPDGGALVAFNYDGNGNLLNLPGRQFDYNVKNELKRFSDGSGLVAEYRYDHLGFRISKTVTDPQGHVTKILYVADQAEVRNGAPAYFVRVGGMRAAVLVDGTVKFMHENGLGSTAFITDSTGSRIGQLDYLPFGNLASSSGDVDFQTYSFHSIDTESGLVYMRRRYYSPQLGRFLTPDMMAIYQPEKFLHAPQALHLYAFVANDPLDKTDPTGMSWWSFFGSVVGVIIGIIVAVAIIAAVVATGGALGVVLGIGLALAAGLLVTGVSYIIASNVDPNSAFGQFMRGFMIGFNAGMNGVLAGAIFGPVVGVALGVIVFLSTFEGISQNSVYQGILGWSSWLMPMSWGATALGLVFYLVNLIVAGVTFQQWDAAKIDKLSIDWKTGTFVMVGGLIRNPTAFDMGNFVFMNPSYVTGGSPDTTYDAVLRHETGHTLAVAAFGSAFGIADLIGENVVGAGASDYGEEIAESHANRPGRPTIPMWG